MDENRVSLAHSQLDADRRVKRTRRLLADALIALVLEQGYETVSIRDITARADIGYATFFRHYSDKDALLADVLEEVLAELLALLQPSHNPDPATIGTLLFQYVEQHSELCRALVGSRGSAALLHKVTEAGTQNMLRNCVARPDATIPAEIAAHHLVASTLSLIQWWLDHDRAGSPEQLGQVYAELIAEPVYQLVFVR